MMFKTLQLSAIGRLSLALALFLALLAAGALVVARTAYGPARGRASAPLGPLGAETAAAQGILPPQPGTSPAPAGGILVSGDGEATGAPDVAYLHLGVQTDGQTARQALDANSTAMAAVIAAIKGAGIADADIQTTGINLTPLTSQPRSGDQTPPQVVGYRATNGVSVTVNDIGKTGSVLDAAVSAGATNAGGVRFAIKDVSGLHQKALDRAGHDARSRADALAASLGVHVTSVQSAGEDITGTPQPLAADRAAAAAAAVPVQPGELTLRVRIHVVYNFA